MNTNTAKVTHSLRCDEAPLAKGVRKERAWSCTCGVKYHGFDSAVQAEHRAHRKVVA